MARIDDVFVTGTIGNLVLYRRMGKPCARIKRDHIKQTMATKKRGINFGIAARAGKGLRKGLSPAMPNPTDRSVQSRFCGAIAKWLRQSEVNTLQPCDNVPFLSFFPFSKEDTFGERFKVPVAVSTTANGIRINLGSFIPSINIDAPAGTVSVRLIISVAAVQLDTGFPSGWQTESIKIPFNQVQIPAKVLDFAVPTVRGTIIVTAARLLYIGYKNNYLSIIDKKGFNAAGVINARYC
jgi:hypothetical protein